MISIVGADYAIVGSQVTYFIQGEAEKVKWYKNDKEVVLYPGEDPLKLNLFDVDYPAAGTYYAIVEKDGQEVKTNEITLVIGTEERKVKCHVSSRTEIEAQLGDEISLAPHCHTEPPSAVRECAWYHKGVKISDDEFISFEIEDNSQFGDYLLKTEAWAYGSYEPYSGTTTLRILEANNQECPFIYIHDLMPARNAGFIQIGWWVYDEIISALKDGFKWEEKPFDERFKYKCELANLAWGFSHYGDLEVQESRNGYIYGRKELIGV